MTVKKKFTRKDIREDPTIQKFFTEKKTRLTSTTQSSYITSFLSFCNFIEKTPSEIYKIHKKDIYERTPGPDVWLANAFDQYIAEISKTHSHDTISIYISKIKSFLRAFRLTPIPDVEIDKKRVYEDAKHALKVEDIRKAIKNSNPTYQAIIITEAQTGLSVSDVLSLDVEDFILAVKYSDKTPQYWPKPGEKQFTERDLEEAIEKTEINKDIIGCFDLRRKKTNNEFYTFAGPECLRAIASILGSRDHHLKPSDPIFIKQICRINKNRKKEVFEDIRVNPFAVNAYFKRLHDEKNIFPKIEVDGKKRNYFRTHKLRKWFSNKVRFDAEISFDDTKYLMGQKTGDVLERYANPNNYLSLKNNYRKALPYLSITENVTVKDNLEAIERLSIENVEIRKENHDLKSMVLEMKEDILNITQKDPGKLQEISKDK